MQTTLRTQSATGKGSRQAEQPKRLSAIGIWLRENPGGIIKVVDRRAVNK